MKRALLRPLIGGLLAISVLASASCVRHECDSHPERCGPRNLLLLSAPLVKQAASSELRFEIQKSGKLINVSLPPPVQGGALEKCVAGVLAQNPFPPNDGNPKFAKPSLGVRFSE